MEDLAKRLPDSQSLLIGKSLIGQSLSGLLQILLLVSVAMATFWQV